MSKSRKTPSECNFKNMTLRNANKKIKLSKEFDLYNLKYKNPVKNDIAVGLVYFNCVKSKRLLMNYLYVIEKFRMPIYRLLLLKCTKPNPK